MCQNAVLGGIGATGLPAASVAFNAMTEHSSSGTTAGPSTKRFKLQVFGRCRLLDANGVEILGPGKLDLGLLAYLALSQRRQHDRTRLAALFWPGRTRALRSLSMSLNVLRNAFGEEGPSILIPKSDPLICNFDPLEVDAQTFAALIAQGTPPALEQAEKLYGGELLEGMKANSEELERRLAAERTRLQGLAVDCLSRLMRVRQEAGQSELALQTANRVLDIDAFREDAHRMVINIHLHSGRRSAALQHADHCESAFKGANVELERETLSLIQEARKPGGNTGESRATVQFKLAAILSADVVGYARHIQQDEVGTFSRLRAHRTELFEPVIAKHHGLIFKLTGDGLMVEFGSIVDAVVCAVLLQRGMVERNAGAPEHQRMVFRMGVNLGDVIVDGKDLQGDGVNIAARLQQISPPGGICVSRTVYNHVKQKLALAFDYLGEQNLKNIAEPVSVYSVRLDGMPAQQIARPQAPQVLPLPDKPSIAVLPFKSLGEEPQWARLADGITEDVTTSLSRSRGLFVIARNSTEVYRGKSVDVRDVGRDLGTKYVLDGSVQALRDRVRVTANLIDAATRIQVWSERYDKPLEDIFGVQDDVTAKIAARLLGNEGALNEAERENLRLRPPASLRAYDYYLLAMQAKHALTPGDLAEARHLFGKALELDAGLARAYVGLAWTYELELGLGCAASVAQARASKLANAQKAVALDPSDGEAHAALATCYADKGDFHLADKEFARAEMHAPNNADILLFHAAYLPQLGKPPLAAEKAALAVHLNPSFPPWYNRGLRAVYYFAGQFDEALAAAQGAEPSAANDFAWIAVTSAQLGRSAEAGEAAERVLALDPEWSAERRMSDYGKFAHETEPLLFAEGARKAGLPVYATAEQRLRWPDMTRLPGCEQEPAQT